MSNYTNAAAAGLALGQQSRLTHQMTLALSKTYAKSEADVRKQMRIDFMVSFIQGALDIDKAKAEGVLATSRDDRTTAQQRAYAQGSDKFAYHIVRDANESKPESSKSEDVVTQCKKYVDSKSLTKAQLKKLIALLSA